MFLVQRRNSFVEEFVRACKEIGVKYIVIEQDLCYDMDVFESVKIGFEGLKRIAKEND